MSFFSRFSNLVNGFAHNFLDSVEQNNPHLVQEQKIITSWAHGPVILLDCTTLLYYVCVINYVL